MLWEGALVELELAAKKRFELPLVVDDVRDKTIFIRRPK
jgi:hypothetical protein